MGIVSTMSVNVQLAASVTSTGTVCIGGRADRIAVLIGSAFAIADAPRSVSVLSVGGDCLVIRTGGYVSVSRHVPNRLPCAL